MNIIEQPSVDDLASPVLLDLFCGAGGMSLGFQMAGFTIGLGVDNDPLACQTHTYNFGQNHTICADITTITDPVAFTLSVRSFSGRIGRMIREPGVDACRKA